MSHDAALPLAGRIVSDEIVPAGSAWSATIPAGECLTILDLEGRQAVDFVVYDAKRPQTHRYNAANAIKFVGTIYLTTAYQVYDAAGRASRGLTRLLQRAGR